MEKQQFHYEIIAGFRKNSKLLVLTNEKQIFRQKHVYKDSTRYKCYFDTCKVSVSLTESGICEQMSLGYHHNHAPPEDLIKKFKIMGNIKSECEKKTSIKRKGVRDIFDEECRKDPELASIVSFTKMKRQLHRIRNNSMPKNPTTPLEIKLLFEEADFLAEYGASKHIDKPFYRETIIEESFAYSVFISPTISSIIEKKPKGRRYLIDGTFKTVPSCGHKQLIIIHFHYMDHTFPFIYVLMTKKSREAYEHLFQFINTNLFQFEASTFHTDYEIALRKAVGNIFPNASLRGCWFHYCQALRRKSRKINKFGSFIRNSEDCYIWYRKFLCLPLVKPEQIEEMFITLKNDLLEFPQNQRECLNIFVKYFEQQWMKKISPSGFSVHLEAVRTTSALEGFNSKLSRKLEKHGRFFQFIEVLRDEDFNHSVSLAQTSAGVLNVLPRKRKPQTMKDNNITQLTHRLSQGNISLSDFFNHTVNNTNCILQNDEIMEDIDEDDLSDSDDLEESSSQISLTTEVLKCIICAMEPRNILLQPCQHFKICTTCLKKLSEKSKTNKSHLLCPYCRQIVENSLKIFQ